MKKLLGLFLVSGAMVTGCGNAAYNDADLIDRIEDLEKENEVMQANYKAAGTAFESTGNFTKAYEIFMDNGDLEKSMWQKWMPETVTIDLEVSIVDNQMGGGVSFGNVSWFNYHWSGVDYMTAPVDAKYYFHNNYNMSGTDPVDSSEQKWFTDEGMVAGNTYLIEDLKLHLSPFNRQYLMVDSKNCSYSSSLLCEGGTVLSGDVTDKGLTPAS